ncbi:hypothetical protein LJR129_004852 [Acidovorax sp. LjRoot129]|uniref:TfpX/TfpZ family type IV pilin accessory protein n=1 Tax=Acidovorax sp. LjRoot129 TaxID=3342260 RepID=UPI003ECCDF1D
MTIASFFTYFLPYRATRALRAAAFHLSLSAAVVAIVALLVFGFWFPGPLRQLSGGAELFWLIVSVDIVCGPLLTMVVFNPTKPQSELRRDLAMVAAIQLLVLGYGIHTLSYARPVALVYEVDRFRVVSVADIDEAEADDTPSWAKPLSFSRPPTIGIRPAATLEENISSIEASMQGIEPSQKPSWWQEYALSVPQVLQRSHDLASLRTKHPAHAALIEAAASNTITNLQPGETNAPATLRWLPLVSRHASDWVVLIDPVTARIRGYIHLDGF